MREKMQMLLSELKKKIDECRLAAAEAEKNHVVRETYSQEIHQLREEIEYDLIHKPSSSVIEEKSEQLHELQEKLQKIDHQLDKIEETEEEEIEQLKEELIKEIHKTYPEAEAAYKKLHTCLLSAQKNHEHLTKFSEALLPFLETMKQGLEAKKLKGGWAFLLGRNRKVLLSQVIHKASRQAEALLSKIDSPAWRDFLSRFLLEAQKPWNSELYKEKFYTFYEELLDLTDKLEDEISLSDRNLIHCDQDINLWLDKLN
ncbi:MAG: hypothetical protein K940chlam9_00988 [Chlamydiae bacterium]|nr:hypothetical protein [Chlamydiota bacterium]